MSKTILITGAGRRLGKTLAEYWLAEGWQVIAHFNTACELESHSNLRTLQADLADLADNDAVTKLRREVALAGPVDAVIHNASCFIPDRAATDLAKHYEVHFNVHVKAPAMITAAIQWAPDAAMVAITDIYADIPNERFAAYCASKAGLQNWALSMAQRLAGKVRVNVIQPGPIQFLPEHDEAYRHKVLSQSLIRRELGYDAIVEACAYLLSAKALTGTVMRVDGGRFVTNRYDQTFSV
ncbi:SDR family NAD(P)-dependent oxidoreductase [Thalassolituus sp.]|uniref:SDR family NAD(P)-dependent oxidoreductase n=1 Tax=Thalassolituus sp. TaxID=2030822 RepID=UPI002A80A964|nr:SDR family NAD(P)-dependent oxidoreductase [Thalassolituus sp.]